MLEGIEPHDPILWTPLRKLWMTRWLLVARAVLMGVNVLLMDTDITVLHDMYRFLKGEPFR